MRKVFFLTELLLRLGIVALGLWLWSMRSDYFDYGEEVCYWKRTYGVECPGCGLTRGTQHFLHGEWEKALEYNPLSLFTGIGFTLLWLLNLWALYRLWRNTRDMETPTQRLLQRFFVKMGFIRSTGASPFSTSFPEPTSPHNG